VVKRSLLGLLFINTWGQPEKGLQYLESESTFDHQLEELDYDVLDFGADVTVLPDERSRMLVRGDYKELHELIKKDHDTSGRQLGGMVVTGHPGISTC
jgi:hypothetical protein